MLRAYQDAVAGAIARVRGARRQADGRRGAGLLRLAARPRGRGRARSPGRAGGCRGRSAGWRPRRADHWPPGSASRPASSWWATWSARARPRRRPSSARPRTWPPGCRGRCAWGRGGRGRHAASLGGVFVLRDLGATRLKGFAHPVPASRSPGSAAPRAASRPAARAGRTHGRARAGAGAGARALAPSRGRRGPSGAAGWRGRDRQVAVGPGGARRAAARGAHGDPLPVLALPHRYRRSGRSPSSSSVAAGLEPADPDAAKIESSRPCCGEGGGGRRGGAAGRGLARDRRGRALPRAGPQPAATTRSHAGRAGRPSPWARASQRPGADGARGRALGRPHHPRAGGPDPRTPRGRSGTDAADEPPGQSAGAGRAPARDAAHAQPPRPRPDARRSSRSWPAGATCRSRCWARSPPGPTGCRCSSRS